MHPVSLKIRAFLVAFTSAFLCFILLWMATLMLVHPKSALPSSKVSTNTPTDSNSSVYLPDPSDCMNLLICEDSLSPSLFFLLRFDPVIGNIIIFSFPNSFNLNLSQVSEPAEKIYQKEGISGIQSALSETYGIDVEKYLLISRESLPALLNCFGSTQLNFSEDIDLIVDGLRITLTKGLQLLDGERLFCWLRSQTPDSTTEQCRFFSSFLALGINQHRSLLLSENSNKLFNDIVNLSNTNLIFSDYDSRKKAADFLGTISTEPAVSFVPEFVRNQDATLTLSTQDREKLCSLFSADS